MGFGLNDESIKNQFVQMALYPCKLLIISKIYRFPIIILPPNRKSTELPACDRLSLFDNSIAH